MAHLDRQRASRLMSQAGIDALILFSPESFSYATGTAPGVATMWRQAGAVAVMVPLDSNMPETAIVSDLFAKQFLKKIDRRSTPESAMSLLVGTGIWYIHTNLDMIRLRIPNTFVSGSEDLEKSQKRKHINAR